MFSYKFISNLRDNALRIRIISNRKKNEISTGMRLSADALENVLSPSPRPENIKWKSVLSNFRFKIEELQCRLAQEGKHNEDVAVVRKLLEESLFGTNVEDEKGIPCDRFVAFYQKVTDKRSNEGYKTSCLDTLKKIREFNANCDSLTFEDINLRWLNDFDEWLADSGLSQNSRAIHFKNIRTVINRAIDEELTNNYPFRRFKIKTEATRKRSLPVKELRKLFTCDVEDYQVFYRDMAKLIFMLCGINAVDLYNLETVTPDGRIEYKRAKTHRLYSIKVEPEAMEIIEKYRGKKKLLCLSERWKSHKDFTKWLNMALKKIGVMKIVGRGGKKEIKPFWPELSSYWMRHSWASIAYNDLDVSKDVIAQGLGHGKKTVTDIYLDKDRRKIDEANRRVLDWVLYGKR